MATVIATDRQAVVEARRRLDEASVLLGTETLDRISGRRSRATSQAIAEAAALVGRARGALDLAKDALR